MGFRLTSYFANFGLKRMTGIAVEHLAFTIEQIGPPGMRKIWFEWTIILPHRNCDRLKISKIWEYSKTPKIPHNIFLLKSGVILKELSPMKMSRQFHADAFGNDKVLPCSMSKALAFALSRVYTYVLMDFRMADLCIHN